MKILGRIVFSLNLVKNAIKAPLFSFFSFLQSPCQKSFFSQCSKKLENNAIMQNQQMYILSRLPQIICFFFGKQNMSTGIDFLLYQKQAIYITKNQNFNLLSEMQHSEIALFHEIQSTMPCQKSSLAPMFVMQI